jgi:hypothetical protein
MTDLGARLLLGLKGGLDTTTLKVGDVVKMSDMNCTTAALVANRKVCRVARPPNFEFKSVPTVVQNVFWLIFDTYPALGPFTKPSSSCSFLWPWGAPRGHAEFRRGQRPPPTK